MESKLYSLMKAAARQRVTFDSVTSRPPAPPVKLYSSASTGSPPILSRTGPNQNGKKADTNSPIKGIKVTEDFDTYYRNISSAMRDIPRSDDSDKWPVLGPASRACRNRTR